MEALRHVAEHQAGTPAHHALGRPQHAQQHADQGRLAGAVRSDQRDDLAGMHRQADRAQQLVAADPDRDRLRLDQPARALPGHQATPGAIVRQRWHRPRASTVSSRIAKPSSLARAAIASWIARDFELGHVAAAVTDQEAPAVRGLGLRTTDVSVQALEPVHEAVRDQKVERAVHGRRLGRAGSAAEPVEHVVRLDRAVALPDQLEHPPAQFGQPRAAPGAQRCRPVQRVVDAPGMIVIDRRQGTGHRHSPW